MTSIAHSAINLLWIPFGTIIGILAIIYLVKPEVRDYFESPQQQPLTTSSLFRNK